MRALQGTVEKGVDTALATDLMGVSLAGFLIWMRMLRGGAIEAAFSVERLGTYLQAAQGDREQAPRLYTRNTALCAVFYGPLQALEVALRNAMHRELAFCHGEEWYDNPAAGLDWGLASGLPMRGGLRCAPAMP